MTTNNPKFPTVEECGFRSDVRDLVRFDSGLVLIAGSMGSGKTTTLRVLGGEAIMNDKKVVHVLPANDQEHLGLREIPLPAVPAVKAGKKHDVKRQAVASRFVIQSAAWILSDRPNVVLFDDIRKSETALLASTLATAGCLVIATVHSTGNDDVATGFKSLSNRNFDGSTTFPSGVMVLRQKLVSGTEVQRKLEYKITAHSL